MKANFSKTANGLGLMSIGLLFSVIFKLLVCRTVGTKTVHYYFGFEECFSFTWIIAFICLIFLIFIKIRLYFYKKKKNNKKSEIKMYTLPTGINGITPTWISSIMQYKKN